MAKKRKKDRNRGQGKHSGGKRRATANKRKADEEWVEEIGVGLAESRIPVERPTEKEAEVGLRTSRVPLEQAGVGLSQTESRTPLSQPGTGRSESRISQEEVRTAVDAWRKERRRNPDGPVRGFPKAFFLLGQEAGAPGQEEQVSGQKK